MKSIRKILILLIVLTAVQYSRAQDPDEPVWRALKDELSRNMKNLSYLDYQKPFFINYTIASNEHGVILASLGGIILSNENKVNNEMVRVMIGNYKVSDENFENENASTQLNGGNIPLPLDNDYYGIRRTLWIQTDKVYKAAGETYKNKIYILNRNNISTDSLVPDFSPAPVINRKIKGSSFVYNKAEWEKRVKSVSAIFSQYPDVDDSGVSFRFAKANTYMVNSEGSEVKNPVDIAVITISAFSTAPDGRKLSDRLEVIAPTPGDLPSDDWFQEEIRNLSERLKNLKSAGTFTENYNGPVLFLDQAASEFISASLFSGQDPLISIREPLYADRNMKIFSGNNPNSLQEKQNRKVVAGDLTVKALPFLKNFGNTPLIGHFEIDAEGVVPPRETVLIEDGMLKTLLNDRTPTRMVPQSNGHRRFAFFNNSVSYITGPGIIEVQGKNQHSQAELKKMLMEKAREEGLDYAIIVRKVMPGIVNYPVEIYKVSLTDGKETLVRSASLAGISLSTLRKCIGTSDRQTAYNMLISVGPDPSGGGTLSPDISGLPASFISPDGFLIEEMEVHGAPRNLSVEKPIVPSPLDR